MINGLDYGEVSPPTHFRVFLRIERRRRRRRKRERRRKADCLWRRMSRGEKGKGREGWIELAVEER